MVTKTTACCLHMLILTKQKDLLINEHSHFSIYLKPDYNNKLFQCLMVGRSRQYLSEMKNKRWNFNNKHIKEKLLGTG